MELKMLKMVPAGPTGNPATRASLFESLLDAMDTAALIIAADGQLVHANRAGAQRLDQDGSLREELTRTVQRFVDRPAVDLPSLAGFALSWVRSGASAFMLAVAHQPAPDTATDVGQRRPPLAPREHQVASLVAEGFSTLNVASQLNIGEETVRTLLKRVFRKWNVMNRVELTRAMMVEPKPTTERSYAAAQKSATVELQRLSMALNPSGARSRRRWVGPTSERQ